MPDKKDRLDIAITLAEMMVMIVKHNEETKKAPRQVIVVVLEMSEADDIDVFMTSTTTEPEILQAMLSDALRQTLPEEETDDDDD